MLSEMEGSQRKRDVQDRRLSIIDVSSADDSLLDPVSGNPHKQDSDNQENAELLDTPNSKKFEDATSKLEEWEQEPRPNEAFEMGKAKKNSKCNLRKSLAWDSAFFTSAGVLDPEELSSIIEGVEKDEKHALPGIKEDVHMSCESISTLESDSLTLENLEADLFEDIRASIQKSSKKSDVANENSKVTSGVAGFQTGDCKHALPGIKEDLHKSCESISTSESDSLTLESLEADLFVDIRASIQKSTKTSDVANGTRKVPSGVAGFQADDFLKTIGMASGSKMKASSSSKNQSTTNVQVSGKMTKNPLRPQVLQKLSAPRGEPSTVKQTKVPVKPNPSLVMSAKRASLGGLHVGSEKDKAKRVIGGRVSSVPKAPTLGGSRGIVPKTTLSSKSSPAPSVATKTKSTSTPFGSNSSGNVGKSPLNSSKRKVDAGTIKPPACGSAVRTPSKTASRNKTESGNFSLSGLMSVTKLSSSISPSSSVSDWSSESSSSTCMTKHGSNSSRTSIDSSTCRKVLSDTHTPQVSSFLNSPSDSSLEGQESQLVGFVSQCVRSTSAGTVIPPAPMKPSGLRLPSPKIGFFDGMKLSGRTPREGMQSHSVVPRGLPKYGKSVSPSEGQNKAKLGKLQTARSIMSSKNTQPNNQQTSQPNPVHESSDVAVMTSCALQNGESTSEIPMEALNKTLLDSTARNTSNNMTEGHLVGIHDLNLSSTQNIGTGDISMEKMSSEIKDSLSSTEIRSTSTDEEPNKGDSRSTYDVENSSSEIVGEDRKYGQPNLPKAEGPVLHDVGMQNSHLYYTEYKEAMDISVDKMSSEGNNAVHSQNNIHNILAVGDHNPSISSAAEIDCLSCQLGVMDINSETQKKFNVHSPTFSKSDVGSHDNLNGVELSGCKELLDCPKEEQSLNGPNTRSLYSPTYTRTPFAVKDSFCNMDGMFRVSAESTVVEVKSTNLSLPESMMKEN